MAGDGREHGGGVGLVVEHVAVELEVVVGGAGVGAVLAPDLFTRMEREDVDLQGQFAVEMFGTDWTFERREGHVVSTGSGDSVIDRLD